MGNIPKVSPWRHADGMAFRLASRLSGFSRTAALLLATAMFASACGGGGGGGGGVGGGTNDTSAPPPDSDFQARADTIASRYRSSGEFSSQWGLGRTRADRAYAHLELALGSGVSAGKGVTIGIVDSGIDLSHPAFITRAGDPDKDRTITRQYLPGALIEDGSSVSHGTAVAGVAAGGRNVGLPGSAHGVAWNANLAVFAVRLGTQGPDYVYRPTDFSIFTPGDRAGLNQWFSAPLAAGVDILNLSFSLAGLIEGYSESTLRANLGDIIRTMAQSGASEKTILVWAASNNHGETCLPGPAECKQDAGGNWRVDATSPSVLAGLPAKISELRGHVIAVVSVGQNGAISSFSNRCGIAADWCLAAPGEDILAPYFGPASESDSTVVRGYRRFSGTSVAAPMVSGGLALMKQLFRGQLSNTSLVSRLFATADKSGRYADRGTYGQGLMDLGAATAPVGQAVLTLGDRVGDPGGTLQTSGIVLGGAFGDGLAQSLAGREIAAFDSLGAPFWFDLGRFAASVRIPSLGERLKDFMAPASPSASGAETLQTPSFAESRKAGLGRWRLGLLEAPAGIRGGHLGLARHSNTFTYTGWKDLAATAFSTEGLSWRAPASGAVLSWRPSGAWAGLRAGWLMERKSLLGSSARGAFGSLSSDSAFVGFSADGSVDGWRLGANAEVGLAAVKPRSGLIADVSPVATGAFAVHATRPFSGDRLFQFSVSQPLRVEHGRATLSVPVGRTKGGGVLRRSVAADIAPTGRQIDVMAHWRQPLTRMGELRLGAVWTHDPGHRAAEGSDLSFMVGWRSPF